MSWYRRGDGETRPESEKLADVEFKPDEFKKELSAEFETKLADLSSKQADMFKPILDMAETIKQEREAKASRQAEEARRAAAKNDEVDTEDYLLDPAAATAKQLEPTNRAVLALAARAAKQDTLGDKEFYHGDIKSKVDALLAQQPLSSQTRADVIENTYKIVVFDHQKDINEGKIKSKNSSIIFEGGSTGGHDGKKSGDDAEILTTEEKEVARRMGISDKDWSASKRELSYV